MGVKSGWSTGRGDENNLSRKNKVEGGEIERYLGMDYDV